MVTHRQGVVVTLTGKVAMGGRDGHQILCVCLGRVTGCIGQLDVRCGRRARVDSRVLPVQQIVRMESPPYERENNLPSTLLSTPLLAEFPLE